MNDLDIKLTILLTIISNHKTNDEEIRIKYNNLKDEIKKNDNYLNTCYNNMLILSKTINNNYKYEEIMNNEKFEITY